MKSSLKKTPCEIPLASSLIDAREVIDVCRYHQVVLAANHTRRWLPDHREIRRLIRQEKVIGDLRHIWISCGGARLSDLGTHWIDWARWLTGEKVIKGLGKLDEVAGESPRGSQFTDYPGEIFMVFENGATAFIHEGQGIALPPRYEVIGTTGRIFGEQSPPGMKEYWKIDVRVREEKNPDPVRGYYGEMERFEFQYDPIMDIDAATVAPLIELLEGKTSCDWEDGYRTLEVLIAAHLSRGYPIFLPVECYSKTYRWYLRSA